MTTPRTRTPKTPAAARKRSAKKKAATKKKPRKAATPKPKKAPARTFAPWKPTTRAEAQAEAERPLTLGRSTEEVANRYEAHREAAGRRNREMSSSAREIGPVPDIAGVARREKCSRSLRLFMETYNPEPLYFGWSDFHLDGIKRIEEAVLLGALYALAWPRGSGKTTICRMATLWAVANHHRRYPFVIGANAKKAFESLDAIKTFMRFLPLFAADYPEISFPIDKLAGIANRASGQTSQGEPTLLTWAKDRVVLPTVRPPANWPAAWPLRADGMVPTAGSLIASSGLTGDGIRGSLTTLATGEQIRPDLVLLDDPQTRKSARSKTQNATREQLISGDVLGMAGPGKSISAVMPCTVIEQGDMVDSMLDRGKHPAWRGERKKLLETMPTNLKAWEEYADVYKDCLQSEPPDLKRANKLYRDKRSILDEGAKATWKARKEEGEVSAIQSAMHLFIRSPRAFFSEYQNEPKADEALDDCRQLREEDLLLKLNRCNRGIVPRECGMLTAFVDVQAEVLFWALCGWTPKFGGALVDWGVYPGQRREVFDAGEPTVRLSDEFREQERGARIYSGLARLVPQILGRSWRQDGTTTDLPVSMCLIDAGFETDAVADYITRSPLRAVLRGSKGVGIGAKGKPMNEYHNEPGLDRWGWNWRQPAKTESKVRLIQYDTNAWKSYIAEAILAAPGSSGSFYIAGYDVAELLRIHLLAEYRQRLFGRGRWVEEWAPRPNCRENHYFDAIVGCAVAASVAGLQWSAATSAGEPAAKPPERKRIKLSERWQQKHGNGSTL